MKFRYIFPTAMKGLRAHKARTGLTILGIVIGIMSIIMVMSIGKGAESLILNQIQGFGSRMMSVEPGREPQGPADIYEMFTESLKDREVEAIRNPANVPDVDRVEPFVGYIDTISYEAETFRATIYGGSSLLLEMFDVYPSEGNMFTDEDIIQRASVVVLGYEVKKELFGDSDAIGKKVKIKDRSFRVVGVLPPKGQVFIMNVDKMIIAPVSTVQKYLLGVSHYHAIMVEADSEELVPVVEADIKRTIRDLHDITDPEKDDFRVETMQDAADRIGVVTDVLTLLLVSVAMISLLVGGIGIMNIMLVSVTERTKEIGLRKALGATGGDIMAQFLTEAVFLTMVGGAGGIFFGASLSWLIAFAFRRIGGLNWDFVFPVSAALVGLVMAGIVGLIFGLYPARQASKKSPIEALRYE